MSLTAGLGQMPANLNPAMMNPAAMQGLADMAAATEAQAALRTRRQEAATAYGKAKGAPPPAIERLLGQDIPFDAIRAEIAQGLDQGIHAAIAAGAEAQVLEEFKDSLSSLLDDIDGQGGLEDWLDGLGAEEGNKEARRLLRSAERLSKGLSSIAQRIDGLKRRADEQIGAAVEDVNAILEQLAETCHDISVDAACGQDPSPLFEARDEHLALLFALLDVVSFIRGDGSAAVYLKGGTPLLDGPTPKRLSFRFGEPVTLDGRDVGEEIGSGRLFGLLSLRDHHLQGVAAQLDGLSQMIREQVNRLFNRAIAHPAQAHGVYAGCREFLNPEFVRLAVSGGDCVLTLFDDGGTILSATCVSQLAAASLLAEGRPTASPWSLAGFAAALDNWLRASLRSDALLAFVDDGGRLCVSLPRGHLTWRDQRCTALDSRPVADPAKPLGVGGAMSFRDIFGNLYTVQIAPTDSLNDLPARFAGSGLNATVVGQRDGHILRINNPAGCDIYAEPDGTGHAGVAAQLRPLPAGPLPSVDLTVECDLDRQGAHLESAPIAYHNRPLGLDGPLELITQEGRTVELWVSPNMTLSGLVGQFNAAASSSGLSAMMKEAGNRWIIRFGGGPGQSLTAQGTVAGALGLRPPPDLQGLGFASFFGLNDFFAPPGRHDRAESKVLADSFATFNATALTLIQRQGRRQTLCFPPGSGLEAIAEMIVAQTELVSAELAADEGGRRLLLTAADGGSLQVTGTLAVLLSFADGGRPKAVELESRPDLLPELVPPGAAALMTQALTAKQTIPAGHVLPAGATTLREAAGGIVGRHRRLLAEGQARAVYQQVLTDNLRRHRRRMNRFDMDADAMMLNTFRDAYLENASVMSGLGRLTAQLFEPAAVH